MREMVLGRASGTRAEARNEPEVRFTLVVAILVFASYYLTSKIGFAFALQPGSVSILWMPNSILLAALLLTGRRWWWLIILAAFPAHFASELQSGVPTGMVLSWFVSNSAQALIGAFCITQLLHHQVRFDRLRDLTVFILCGAFLAPFIASFLDVALVKLNGWGNTSTWDIWSIRFLSNVLATLTLVPAAVVWSTSGVAVVRSSSLKRYVEAALLMAGLVTVGLFVFTSQTEIAERTPSLLYWPLPFLLWASVRFGSRGSSTSLLVVMFLTISGATHGQGPFVISSSIDNALAIQRFLIVASIPMMILAAVIEERRRAEESALQNEERLTLALNAARMSTLDWQISDDSLILSEDTNRLLGLRELDGCTTLKSFLRTVHLDDRAKLESAIAGAVASGTPYEVEFRLVARGTTRWVLSKGAASYDQTGKPVRMLGLGIDITERKLAEETLKQTENRLARTEAVSLVMATHVGLDGRWLKVPPTLCDLVGYSEEELLALRFRDVMHPDDFEPYRRQCLRLVRGEIRSFDLESRYLRKDGQTLWVYLNCSVVEDDHSRPIHFLTYIKDITDRQVASQALLEINERNQAILRALPDMMFLHSREGVYLDYYAREPSALVAPPETFLGKGIRDIMPPEFAERAMESIGKLSGTEEIQVLDYELQIGGEQRHYEARLVNAEKDKVLSIVRDVTEMRRAADALVQSEKKLIESNQQIRALAARLITAQESERRRIALLLHDDVSQRIAAIAVAISRLKRKPPTGRHEMMAELDEIGSQLNDLTTQIRQLSHQLHPEVLEHVGLVAALESHVSEFGHGEQITMSFKSEVQTERFPLDLSVCLYHVAFEAMRNISKHSDATSAAVTLVEDGDFLTLEVSDRGRGFDVERAKRGSGIGLISAEERVKLLRGTFEIKSTPISGTTIVARVPLTR